MSEELTQLKDDLAKLLEAAKIYDARYKGADWKATLSIIESRIAKLEAEQADPWRQAKDIINRLRENRLTLNTDVPKIICAFFDHLTAERDGLAARVAELEAVLKRIATVPDCGCVPCRGQCDSVENLKVDAEEIREIARAALKAAKGGQG